MSGQGVDYSGHRILEAMRDAVAYSEAVFARIRDAMPVKPGNVLDFGAGDGIFTEKFHSVGLPVDCVEPDPILHSSLNKFTRRSFVDVREAPTARYDFIYTVNVLEHIAELDMALNELYRVMAPGGRLFVFVPAFNILWTSLDDEVRHIQRFRRSTLVSPLERAGFNVSHVEYFDSLGFGAALGVRIAEKLGLFAYGRGTIGFYDRYLFPVSQQLDLVFHHVLGKNIIALADKPATQ